MRRLTDHEAVAANQHGRQARFFSRVPRATPHVPRDRGRDRDRAVILLSTSGGDDDEPAAPRAGDGHAGGDRSAAPGATRTETPEPTPTPKPEPPLDHSPASWSSCAFNEGETVSFRVRADTADEIHVHGYDLMKDIEPGKTILFSFKADIVGIFEIELEDAGEQIAQLRVDPGDPSRGPSRRSEVRSGACARAGSHNVVTKSDIPLGSAPSPGAGRSLGSRRPRARARAPAG